MLLLIFGQDTYRLHKRLKEVIREVKESSKGGLSLEFFDWKEDKVSFKDFVDKAHQGSIFQKESLFVLKNFFDSEEFKNDFSKDYKKSLKDVNIVFFQEGKVLKSDELFKFIKKEGKIEEYNLLKEKEIKGWIKDNFKELKVENNALDEIINYVGNDLWRIKNEIEKLSSFKKGSIEINDVRKLIEPKTESAIFETIDAIAKRDKKLALELIHKHLKKGDPPFYLLSMINYQFRNIISVKDMKEKGRNYGQIIKESGLHPFVVKKSLSLSEKFSMEDLKKIYKKIFQTDISVKTGKIESEASLDFLISAI